MPLPNYKNGSIVNLMTSVVQSYNQHYKSQYKALQQLPAKEIKEAANVIFLIIDGFGYEYLQKYGKDTFLERNCRAKITSVFPSTTAAAITTFNTGAAPQQHALTGWYMYLKELGVVTAILPFTPRIGGVPFSKTNVDPKLIFNQKSIFERINAAKYIVTDLNIVSSDYSLAMAPKIKRYAYKNLNQLCKTLKYIVQNVKSKGYVNQKKQKKFIYAYWPTFDSHCHNYGTKNKKTFKHFKRLNLKINALAKQLQGTNTIIIITADHGLIDTSKEKNIRLKDHPQLQETLVVPLTGEPRAAYCYVRVNKAKQFEQYVRKNFSKECTLYKSEELVKRGYFGLGLENPRLAERIGDYTLIMNENYTIHDELLGEERNFHKGTHGGTSKEEMYVPLIVIKCKNN